MKKRLGKDPLSWIGETDPPKEKTVKEKKEIDTSSAPPKKKKTGKREKNEKQKQSAILSSDNKPTVIPSAHTTPSAVRLTVSEQVQNTVSGTIADRELPALSVEPAPNGGSDKREKKTGQWVAFRINRELYAFDIQFIREVVTDTPLTQMPDAADYIAGMTTVRDMMIPVIHLKKFFGMKNCSVPEHYSVIIVTAKGFMDGFLVDEMLDVIQAGDADIAPVPDTVNGKREKAITGVIRCGLGLVSVINPLNIIHFTQNQKQERGAMQEKKKSAETDSTAGRAVGTSSETIQFVSFFIDKDEFAVDIKDVQEINKMITIAHVPKAPKFVEGVINLRGSIVPVLNLRERFGIEKIPYNRNTRIIVINIAGKQVGLIVDSVSEVIRIQTSAIKDPPTEAVYQDSGLVKGMAEIGGRIVIIVDLEGILSDQETTHLHAFHDNQN